MPKPQILDGSPVRKNLDLPQWAIDELTEKAEIARNKFKPYVELLLIEIAHKYRLKKEKA